MPTKKTCIFCGHHQLTAEHFWSQWMHPRLRTEHETNSHTEVVFRDGVSENWGNGTSQKKRPGPMRSMAPRIVCGPRCNGGWMNNNETRVQACLQELAWGDRQRLSVEDQTRLATWLAMKSIVGEYLSKDEAFTPLTQRQAFLDGGLPPASGWVIQIASYSGIHDHLHFRSAFYGRGSPVLQQTSLWLGKLFASVIVAPVPANALAIPDPRFATIWPQKNREVEWSGRTPLCDVEAQALSQFVKRTVDIGKATANLRDALRGRAR